MYKNKANISAMLFCVVLLLVVLNSTKYFFRLDVTENKVYTISPVTKKLIKSLDNKVTITYYLSKILKDNLVHFQSMDDLLYEYAFESKNIQYNQILVTDENEESLRLRQMGLQTQGYNFINGTQYVTTRVYSGIVISYLDRQMVIPFIADDETLEYNLTSFIKVLISKKERKLGVVTGAKYQHIENFHYLDREFNTIIVEYIEIEQPIAMDIDVIFVFGMSELSKNALFNIDQFIMRGGGVLLGVDKVNINVDGILKPDIVDDNSEFLKMLKSYGITLKNALVLDEISKNISYQSKDGYDIKPYPFWVSIISENFSKENKLTSHIPRLDLFWVTPLEFDKNNKNIIPIMFTSKKSWVIENDLYIDPTQEMYYNLYKDDHPQKYPVAVKIEGNLKSYFSQDKDKPSAIRETSVANVLIIGDSDFANFNILRFVQSDDFYNIKFLGIAYDYLTKDSDLLLIKTKSTNSNSLDKIGDASIKKSFLYAVEIVNIILVPAFVILFGIFRLIFINKRKKAPAKTNNITNNTKGSAG